MRHFELYVAVRYLLARRKQAFLSLISLISTVGVSVGVMALIIALALMTGLQQELRDRIVGSAAHVYVWKVGEGGIADYQAEVATLSAQEHVRGAAPAVLGKALVTTDKGEGFITVKGIDPQLETRVTDIARAMTSGGLAGLAPASETDPDGIVIGSELAQRLGVAVGDTVSVLTPHGSLSPMGMMPRTRRLEVVGIFTLGLFEFDSAYGFVSLPVAQRLVDRDRVDFVQLRIDDIYAAPQVAEQLSARLGNGYITQDWADLNQSLFSALWLEKMAISITIGLIVMVAALNIVASLILLVMEKSRDIAILKTMGASAGSIMTIFLLQGLIIGLVGTTVGAAAGLGVAWVCNTYKLIRIPMDVYQVSYVPFRIVPWDFAMVILAAVVICFVATIYPSRQAARLDPAQALRYQ
ncbi:MAG: lipoprotein-releasing ABC transporter permease subunit [Acidobacteria bacterium]|nr:lipoprotein-releasing ABC transporter permease subunit [Acidobacteriota bacterium]